jgi:hypothetical protein
LSLSFEQFVEGAGVGFLGPEQELQTRVAALESLVARLQQELAEIRNAAEYHAWCDAGMPGLIQPVSEKPAGRELQIGGVARIISGPDWYAQIPKGPQRSLEKVALGTRGIIKTLGCPGGPCALELIDGSVVWINATDLLADPLCTCGHYASQHSADDCQGGGWPHPCTCLSFTEKSP